MIVAVDDDQSVSTPEGFVWRFNLYGIAEMLNDYFVQDQTACAGVSQRTLQTSTPFGTGVTV